MAPKKKKPPSTAHYTHDSAGRPNLPTAETQDMMPDEEQQPHEHGEAPRSVVEGVCMDLSRDQNEIRCAGDPE